jgi:hypothetical protein
VKIELLTKNKEDEYAQLLLKDDRVGFNSSLIFMRLLKWITKAEPYYLIALEDNQIVGALPSFLKQNHRYGNVLNSLPWYGSNPGITVDPSYPNPQQIKISLLNAFCELAREKDVVTSTIVTKPFEKDQDLYDKYTKHNFLDSRIGMITSLPEFSSAIDTDLMAIIHSKTRNLIRKAQKSDISFWHDSSIESLHFLAQLHTENMKAIGVSAKDKDFFDALARLFMYDEDYRVYIAEKGGINIAALLVTYFNKTVSYFTPAVAVDYRKYQPLNLLIYNAMKDAAQKGCCYWNWGGTAHSAKGVYHFKKRWGSEECVYYYYVKKYKDISDILSLKGETLLNEYPFFYIVPFRELKKEY